MDECNAIFKWGVFRVELASPGEVTGKWRVILWAYGNDLRNWYIVNTEDGATVKIGPVSRGRGTNYYDRAHAECNRRNQQQ